MIDERLSALVFLKRGTELISSLVSQPAHRHRTNCFIGKRIRPLGFIWFSIWSVYTVIWDCLLSDLYWSFQRVSPLDPQICWDVYTASSLHFEHSLDGWIQADWAQISVSLWDITRFAGLAMLLALIKMCMSSVICLLLSWSKVQVERELNQCCSSRAIRIDL